MRRLSSCEVASWRTSTLFRRDSDRRTTGRGGQAGPGRHPSFTGWNPLPTTPGARTGDRVRPASWQNPAPSQRLFAVSAGASLQRKGLLAPLRSDLPPAGAARARDCLAIRAISDISKIGLNIPEVINHAKAVLLELIAGGSRETNLAVYEGICQSARLSLRFRPRRPHPCPRESPVPAGGTSSIADPLKPVTR